MIDTTLQNLGLHEGEAQAFLFLLEHGAQTAGNLAKKTGISRPSLYGFLKKLQAQGFVLESQKNGIKTFQASSQEKILAIVNERAALMEKGKSDIEKIFSQMHAGALPRNPKFQLFEGKESVRQALNDILLHRNMETKSFWPIKTMISVLGEDFFRKLNRERIKRNIYIRAIWPEQQRVDIRTHPYLGVGEKFHREIRVAPKEIDFEMGYWIYENKVVFLSSVKESFGFIVESRELADMLSTQFNMIWKVSKKISVPDSYTQGFLDDIK